MSMKVNYETHLLTGNRQAESAGAYGRQQAESAGAYGYSAPQTFVFASVASAGSSSSCGSSGGSCSVVA